MIPVFTDGFFEINHKNGFLPNIEPLEFLPDTYSDVQSILTNLSSYLCNIEEDLLLSLINNLPDFSIEIENVKEKRLLTALFRGYCFLASGYLLYPSYVTFKKTGKYGIARERLPVQLANPLKILAHRLNVFPFLEYSYGYSLGNYVKKDKQKGLNVENLKMANCFSGTEDENGFIMVHVDINQYTPVLIEACDSLLEHKDIDSLEMILKTLQLMNESRQKMWKASRYERYNDFRVFIMGIQGNTRIFPNGVIYEPETEPRYYRGQSGSQDTIIPFLDTFFRVCDYYPDNELTSYLMEMRQYRPKPFRDLLKWVETNTTGFIHLLLELDTTGEIASLLVQIYKQIYNFRNGHWQFVQQYIMKNTKYPTATGGTPITTWLPNQIMATLRAMHFVLKRAEKYHDYNPLLWYSYEKDLENMLTLLKEQKALLGQTDFDVDNLFNLNSKFNENDIIKSFQ